VAFYRAEIVVTRGARHRPPLGERLLGHEDLLRGYPEGTGAVIGRGRLRDGAILGGDGPRRIGVEIGMKTPRRSHDGAFLEAQEVFTGGVEAVRMIHPEARGLAFA